MKVLITNRVPENTAIIGVGIVSPGDAVDVNETLAQNLIREGRATLPPSSKAKPEKSKETKTESVQEAEEEA